MGGCAYELQRAQLAWRSFGRRRHRAAVLVAVVVVFVPLVVIVY